MVEVMGERECNATSEEQAAQLHASAQERRVEAERTAQETAADRHQVTSLFTLQPVMPLSRQGCSPGLNDCRPELNDCRPRLNTGGAQASC